MADFSARLRTRPVQARAARTVEQILATAARLLDEVGYDSFNTNLLAERAGVRVRTVYRYFDDKQTIVLCLAEQMYERADESLRKTLERLADPSQPWRAAIDEVIADYFRTMSNTPGWVAIRRALQAVPGLDEIRRQTVARHAGWLADALIARGINARPTRARIIAAAAFAAASAIITPAVRGNARQRKAIAEEMKVLVHSYLAHYLDGDRPGDILAATVARESDQEGIGRHTSGLRAAVDPDTEEGRDFLQARTALFGKLFFIVALTFYAVANLPLDLWMGRPFDWVDEWFGSEERLTLALIAVAGILWAVTRGPARSRQLLKRIDAFAVVVSCGLLGAMLHDRVVVKGQTYQVFVVLLACSNIVTVRAIVVPSSLRRTLALSVVALLLPVAMVAYTTLASPHVAIATAANLSIGALLWATIAVTSASVTSRILFQLRGQVREIEKLGQYVLEEQIGAGGMGMVYRARHAMLRRPTAVKLLLPDKNSETNLRRFEREVQRTARLSHPNTIAVYDYGRTPAGLFYYAMELVDGITLQQLVERDGPQAPARVVHILQQVCGALAEAHQAGLIHRDIKPANIMLCERAGATDMVKVLDFGLVKELETDPADHGISTTGLVLGTPHYLSPEAIEAPSTVGPASDIYALGAVGYFLITGKPLFEAETIVALCSKQLSETPIRPSERLGRPVPHDLEAILMACLEKRPEDRPASVTALADELSRVDCAAA